MLCYTIQHVGRAAPRCLDPERKTLHYHDISLSLYLSLSLYIYYIYIYIYIYIDQTLRKTLRERR